MIANHPLKKLIANRIAAGLKRSTIQTCSQWAEQYRMMGPPFPGRWTFEKHPWLLEMHDAEDEKIVGQKAAQMGYTEWAMNMSFFNMDVLGLDVLYILPTSSDASDFSAGRFDPALELSPHLNEFFADVNNVGLKRAGTNILYVRGSHSRSKLKSIPTPVIIFDEVDEMPDASIALAEERQSGQIVRKQLHLSTPSIDGYGINKNFKLSSEEYFHFKCPSCSRFTSLEYPECLEITAESLTDKNIVNSRLICKECQATLPLHQHENGLVEKPWLKHKQRGGTACFVPSHTDRDIRGFHVSQLYSMAQAGHPKSLAYAALKAELDPTYAQEWYNSKLGKCFVAPGARVTQQMIEDCIGEYMAGVTAHGKVKTLGIDVGSVLHIVVKEWTPNDVLWIPGLSVNDKHDCRIVEAIESTGSANDFNEAYDMFMDHRCLAGVVDAEPERRAALQFAQRLWGRIYLCDYLYSQMGREVTVNEDEASIKVNRTSWLDLSLGRYKNGTVKLPVDRHANFDKQIKEPVRVYKEDKWGQPYAVYQNVEADHFAHADCYAEIAFGVSYGVGTTQDIVSNR